MRNRYKGLLASLALAGAALPGVAAAGDRFSVFIGVDPWAVIAADHRHHYYHGHWPRYGYRHHGPYGYAWRHYSPRPYWTYPRYHGWHRYHSPRHDYWHDRGYRDRYWHDRHRYDRYRYDRHRYDRHRYDRHRYDRDRYDRDRHDRHRYDRYPRDRRDRRGSRD